MDDERDDLDQVEIEDMEEITEDGEVKRKKVEPRSTIVMFNDYVRAVVKDSQMELELLDKNTNTWKWTGYYGDWLAISIGAYNLTVKEKLFKKAINEVNDFKNVIGSTYNEIKEFYKLNPKGEK